MIEIEKVPVPARVPRTELGKAFQKIRAGESFWWPIDATTHKLPQLNVIYVTAQRWAPHLSIRTHDEIKDGRTGVRVIVQRKKAKT